MGQKVILLTGLRFSVMYWKLILTLLLHTCYVECRLIPGYNGTACPNSVESFTCEVEGSAITWVVTPVGTLDVATERLTPSTPLNDLPPSDLIDWSFTFSYNPVTGNSTSIMTAVITPNLKGATLDCRNEPQGMGSQLAGSIIIQIASLPDLPFNITFLVASSSSIGASVSLHWNPPNDNGGRDGLDYALTVSQLPNLSNYSDVVTSTSVTVTDADYNVDYTVSVVATNCAGTSSAALSSFRIDGCPPLMDPMNGAFGPIASRLQDTEVTFECDSGYQSSVTMVTCEGTDTLMWSPDPGSIVCTLIPTQPMSAPAMNCTEQLSPPQNGSISDHTVPALPGTQVTFQCDSGLFPDMIMTATCQPTGQWDRDPRNITCRTMPVSCDLPDPPLDGLMLDPNTNTTEGSVISIQCEPGYMLLGEGTATCSNSGSWEPDLTMLCVAIATASPIGPIVGGVLGGLLFLIVQIVIIIIVLLVVSSKRAKYTVPAGPVYDEVSPATNQQIELNTNSAYGPVTPGPVYEDVLPASKQEIELKTNNAYGQVGR